MRVKRDEVSVHACGHTHTHAYAPPSAAIVLLQVDASHVTPIEDIVRSVCFTHHTRLYASAHARLHECARALQALQLSTLPVVSTPVRGAMQYIYI